MKIEKQNPGFAKRVKNWLTGKYVENGSTASQNIPAGKWVTWKGQVCKAKTAITMGDTLSSTNLATDEEGALNSKLTYKDENSTYRVTRIGNLVILEQTVEWFFYNKHVILPSWAAPTHPTTIYYWNDTSQKIQWLYLQTGQTDIYPQNVYYKIFGTWTVD